MYGSRCSAYRCRRRRCGGNPACRGYSSARCGCCQERSTSCSIKTSRHYCDVGTIPKLFTPCTTTRGAATRVATCCPFGSLVCPELEARIENKIISVISTCVACCIIPLQGTMCAMQIRWDNKLHRMHLMPRCNRPCWCLWFPAGDISTFTRWRQIPSFRMLRIIFLAISSIAVTTIFTSSSTV